MKIEDFRYERKFFITELSREKIQRIVFSHPAIFREIYHERTINNVYFDTHTMINYVENVEGDSERVKFRIRWYGELFGKKEKPVLELKIKKALLGKKRSFKLAPFSFDRTTTSKTFQDSFAASNLPHDVLTQASLQIPSLVNRYRRKYYMSADKIFRITIDDRQTFYSINKNFNNFVHHRNDNENVILELKYDQAHFDKGQLISTYFPFRMTKSSKYVRGVDSVMRW